MISAQWTSLTDDDEPISSAAPVFTDVQLPVWIGSEQRRCGVLKAVQDWLAATEKMVSIPHLRLYKGPWSGWHITFDKTIVLLGTTSLRRKTTEQSRGGKPLASEVSAQARRSAVRAGAFFQTVMEDPSVSDEDPDYGF